ncbi:hypothetical protein KUTeg_012585 [Tegillarca granosa]|uniref:Histone deacetylase complex subunit SAP130 C-terminal domain-containing protein n=1 Tax=Tegillarca granosa TaxID=220873 RepID=A0ABQ9F3J3_TEGGR|nr:hypothetical protein KUTeg_012585 [Tegillarca granosa]
MSSQSSGERRHDDQGPNPTSRPQQSFTTRPPAHISNPVSTVSQNVHQYQTLSKTLARTPLQLTGGTPLVVPPAHCSAITRPTVLPSGATIAAGLAGPKATSTAVPVRSSHPGLPNTVHGLGTRGPIINQAIRPTTPPLSTTRSVSPVVSISASPVPTSEALRSSITIQSSGASSNPSSIQITLPAPRTSTDMTPKPIITHQPPKQIHMTQPIGAGYKLGTPALPPGVTATLSKGKATGTSISNPSYISTPGPTTPTMSTSVTTVATTNASITSIPVAKVPPVRQQQPSAITPLSVTHTTVAAHTVVNTTVPTAPSQTHDHSRTEASSQHQITSVSHGLPNTQGSTSSVFIPQAHRATPVTTVMTSSIPISTSLGQTESRSDRPAGIPYAMPYLIPAEYQLMYQQNLMAQMAAMPSIPGTSPLRQGLIPSQTPNLAATLQAAGLAGTSSTPAAVRFNSMQMLAIDQIRQQSLSSVHSPFTTSISSSSDSAGRSSTPSDASSSGIGLVTTASIPIPAISAIQISGTPVKKPVCGLNNMDRHSPRPDSRTDSAPQSNTSSPKTPATPAGESQSSTDTALSSEATTPTQNSTDLKIKQEPPDSIENGFPSLNSNVSTLPNNLEASPRKKPRKQLLHANEEIRDQSSSDEDDEEIEKLTDIKDELVIKQELRDEYVDEDGVRWTLDKVRPNISLLNFYNISWKPKHNHFLRYTDVKPKEERRPTVNELSNQRGVSQKASGWKLYHMAAQLEDLTELEKTLFSKVSTIQSSVAPRGSSKNNIMDDSEGVLHELTQGNIQRCKLIMDQLEEARTSMLKVLDHKQKIFEIINKHMSKRPIKKKERS